MFKDFEALQRILQEIGPTRTMENSRRFNNTDREESPNKADAKISRWQKGLVCICFHLFARQRKISNMLVMEL